MGIVLINLTVFDDDTADDEEGIPLFICWNINTIT